MEYSGCSSQMNRNIGKGSHNPRRYWTPQEEQVLTNALLAFRATSWKCDGSFKGRYMVRLEGMLVEKIPTAGIRVTHIKSKLQVWKKAYAYVCGVLGSSGRTGASLDPTTNMIICESESVWDDYVKVHNDTAKLRGRPLPWFNSWAKIFGNDRAHGTGAIDVGDAVNELLYDNKTKSINKSGDSMSNVAAFTPLGTTVEESSDDAKSNTAPTIPAPGPSTSLSLGKRKHFDSSMEVLQGMMGKWMDDTNASLRNLAATLKPVAVSNEVEHDHPISSGVKLYESVAEIGGLTLPERIQATHLLAHSEADRETYWGMLDEARAMFIRMLLSGNL